MKVLTKTCMRCNKAGEVDVPEEGYAKWKAGAFIQDAMPEVPAPLREQLITGTHPACWEQMFAGEEY